MSLPPDAPRNAGDPHDTRYDDPPGDANATGSSETPTVVPLLATPPPGDSQATLPAPPPSVPTRFGKYRLLRRVAHGGMGSVYRAEELGAGHAPGESRVVRTVALKRILRERLEFPSAVERFQREINLAKQLDHPSIVPVYESGVESGEHYFTMPLVEGGSLQQYVEDRARRLTPRQAAHVMAQVVSAVQYAHQHQPYAIIHRDIKPQNILLQPNTGSSAEIEVGESQLGVTARLTDFGLARLLAEDSTLSLSQKGEAMGTPGYMPPEQARGDLDRVGTRSDVYSLGAVLYALLTGRPPFPINPQSSVLETLRQVEDAEPIRPRVLNPEVPPYLEAICLKCLQKEPDRRYADARQLNEALDDFLHECPTIRWTPAPAGWVRRAGQRLARSIRKHPFRAAYISGSAVVILLLLAWVGVEQVRRSSLAEQQLAEAQGHFSAARDAEANGNRSTARKHYADAVSTFTDLFKRYRRFDQRPGVRLDAIDAQLGLADLDRRESRFAESLAAYQEALTLLESMTVAGEADSRRRRLLAETLHRLGVLFSHYQTREKEQEALAYFRKALPIREQLCREQPERIDYLRDLARTFGFMGDTQLDLLQATPAKESYDRATEIRKRLIDLPSVKSSREKLLESLCQHGRDFGNFALYYDRLGRELEALRYHHERLRYFAKEPLSGTRRLPNEFLNDRAECLVVTADLQIDLDPKNAEAPDLLDAAMTEYERIKQDSNEWKAGYAFAKLVKGKALASTDRATAVQSLEEAEQDLTRLAREVRAIAENRYRRAVARAWLGWLSERPDRRAVYQDRAMQDLELAVKSGFPNLPRLARDKGMSLLGEADLTRKRYQDVVATLKVMVPRP